MFVCNCREYVSYMDDSPNALHFFSANTQNDIFNNASKGYR